MSNGGLQSRAAHNCLTQFRGAYNQRRVTIELIWQGHNRLLEKANENVANARKHEFFTRLRHEVRYRDPPVKTAPCPLHFNPAAPCPLHFNLSYLLVAAL